MKTIKIIKNKIEYIQKDHVFVKINFMMMVIINNVWPAILPAKNAQGMKIYY